MKWSFIVFCFVGLLFFDCSNHHQEEDSFSYGSSNGIVEEVWVCSGRTSGKYHYKTCGHLNKCSNDAVPKDINEAMRIRFIECLDCYGHHKDDPNTLIEQVFVCKGRKVYHSFRCENYRKCESEKLEMTEKEAIDKTLSKCETCYGQQNIK
jgi:hypothetical protein